MIYQSWVAREQADKSTTYQIETLDTQDLPQGEVLVSVQYAGLNYKDALSFTGNRGVTRKYPHTPGIDAAGIVAESSDARFKPGDAVIVTSYDLGMNTPGGFGAYIRVPAAWVIPLPDGMSLEASMALGTAGLTAGIAIHKMTQCGQNPSMGPILVTGASGGVGSMSVAILAKLGYEVIASTGKQPDFLMSIGAKQVVDRAYANDGSGKPLLKPMWAGAIDTVGDNTLATCLKGCGRNGCVATTGLVASPNLQTTVFPFILNGVNLLGVESAEFPMPLRQQIWTNLAQAWMPTMLGDMYQTCSLADLARFIPEILAGKVQGRVVVDYGL
jgi:alcohol dehydrogenase